jgi:dipeptidyl aminopeptidase/acylaminoacyl peptidase
MRGITAPADTFSEIHVDSLALVPATSGTQREAIATNRHGRPMNSQNDKRTFAVDDLYLHLRVTELDRAPDGSEIAATVRSVNREENKYQFAIWSFALDGRPALQLTQTAGGTDNTPHWSPDGNTLAVVSDRNGSPQVHTLARRGAAARRRGGPGRQLRQRVSDLHWFPDGKSIPVASASVSTDDKRIAYSRTRVERIAHCTHRLHRRPGRRRGADHAVAVRLQSRQPRTILRRKPGTRCRCRPAVEQ